MKFDVNKGLRKLGIVSISALMLLGCAGITSYKVGCTSIHADTSNPFEEADKSIDHNYEVAEYGGEAGAEQHDKWSAQQQVPQDVNDLHENPYTDPDITSQLTHNQISEIIQKSKNDPTFGMDGNTVVPEAVPSGMTRAEVNEYAKEVKQESKKEEQSAKPAKPYKAENQVVMPSHHVKHYHHAKKTNKWNRYAKLNSKRRARKVLRKRVINKKNRAVKKNHRYFVKRNRWTSKVSRKSLKHYNRRTSVLKALRSNQRLLNSRRGKAFLKLYKKSTRKMRWSARRSLSRQLNSKANHKYMNAIKVLKRAHLMK